MPNLPNLITTIANWISWLIRSVAQGGHRLIRGGRQRSRRLLAFAALAITTALGSIWIARPGAAITQIHSIETNINAAELTNQQGREPHSDRKNSKDSSLAKAIDLSLLDATSSYAVFPTNPTKPTQNQVLAQLNQLAQASNAAPDSLDALNSLDSRIEAGRSLYRNGRYAEAIIKWQQALHLADRQNELVAQAMVQSNLALAYQKQGQWTQAEAAIASSLALLNYDENAIPAPANQTQQLGSFIASLQPTPTLAQALNTKASLQFARGQTRSALTTWQIATAIYQQVGNPIGEIRGRLNQAQALKALGFFRRALNELEQVKVQLQDVPSSAIAAAGWRNLGDALVATGEFEQAETALNQSLAIAQATDATDAVDTDLEVSSTFLSLGNLFWVRAQQAVVRSTSDINAALGYYEAAANAAILASDQINADLNRLHLLTATERLESAIALANELESPIANLPPSRDHIYARINYAGNLVKIADENQNNRYYLAASDILAKAIAQAKELKDQRSLAYGLGNLAHVYEQTGQLAAAKQLSEEALAIAQSIDAPDIAYRWQWQLGRILSSQGDPEAAVAAYSEAVNSLEYLRSDLVATSQGVQFSFRDSVEPVYRQLVSLLLSDQFGNGVTKQKNLLKAQAVIESLRQAELVDFFRADCVEAKPVTIAALDPNAALIYPVVLDDRLEVILRLPDQPLRHYATTVTSSRVNTMVVDLRINLLDRTAVDYLAQAQQLYDWLIRPAATEIANSKASNLIFVLDDALRNVPMAVLHDGDRYLGQDYSIAMAPGLELIESQQLDRQEIVALTAGLTEARQGFSSLPNVELELTEINSQVPSQILLNQEFTNDRLTASLQNADFPIIHLATHGEFSSKAEDTFLLTWDSRLNIEDLKQLLGSRSQSEDKAIELLILSACETAVGDRRAALGLAGMAVRAGARSTLASLWSIDDAATAQFMARLYDNLGDRNISRAKALQKAQIALINDPEYNHPFFWAPFVMVGNWL
ncbi:Tetratricopeptide TPR_2 repeat-containing protein [Thalassoporum mexicanum PCC 7367]|uniref:CHAT domain-containing protein n=1 Tax=Thalassoporum mexicanum TaxID=3457544 RepID=UPI00029FC5CF|nr:CHAT domain-containing protein [Pseudanabaena sp. PCC 7367]AFY68929.1 Tetratricopeptide TPR_2 repeat-containing protein [Pseudanabaena sp. PCC 7367]